MARSRSSSQGVKAPRKRRPTHSRVICSLGRLEPLETSLRLAFERFRRLSGGSCVLQLESEQACTREVVARFAHELTRCPDLHTLTLVHESESTRALASRLDAIEGVTVRASVDLHALDEISDVDPTAGETLVDGEHPFRVRIMRLTADVDFEDGIRSAFEELRRRNAEAAAIVIVPEHEVSPEMIQSFAYELQSCKNLRVLVVVHPSPLVGYGISMLMRHAPGVMIASCASEAEIERSLPR